MLKIIKEEVKNQDVSWMKEIVVNHEKQHVDEPAGASGYRLFAYIADKINNCKIAEIGSRNGSSAVAFSHNPTNEVHAYEIDEGYLAVVKGISKKVENVTAFGHNVLLEETVEECLKYDVIFLDPTPHHGIVEKMLIDYLKDNNWRGVLIMDDIGSDWPKMNKLWNELTLTKFDVTDIGHHAGMGIVDYSGELSVE